MQKLCTFLLFLLVAIPGYATTTNKISEFHLSNGLKLIVKEDHRAPIVVSQLWYKVGSSYETNGITGISHVLEHMMFRGTKNFGPGQLKHIIADNGGLLNAFTDYDFTAYYEILAAEKLPIALTLEADRMQGLLLNKDLYKKELQVILEERRMRTQDDPHARLFERFMAVAHLSNPYHHPVIGWHDDIQHLTVSDLRYWYSHWYSPNNAVLVIVGDVNPQSVYQLVKKYFGPIPKKQLPILKPQQEIPQLGTRTVTISVPAKLPFLVLGYNVPSLKTAKHKWEAYALFMTTGILDAGNSARLSKELLRKQQVAVSASASYSLYKRLDDVFVLSGIPAPNQSINQLKSAFFNEIHKLQTTLVTQKELDRIKNQVLASEIYKKDSIEHQATEIGALESIGLSWRDEKEFIKNIKAITPEQIQTVAKKYLIPNRLTIGVLNPLPISHPDK